MKLFTNKTILVADDDPGNRELVVSTMNGLDAGIRVLSAVHGGQVLDILGKREVDAVLLDWEMPVRDGFSVLQEMKSDEKLRDIPVLMYTGVMTAAGNLVKALEIGAVDFIRKPTEPVELIARIKSVLRQQEDFRERNRLEQESAEMRHQLLSKANESLQQQLNEYLIQLARKNEMFINIRDYAKKCENQPEFLEYLDGLINLENYWDELFRQFSRFEKDFLNTIISKHPDLSQGEIRFCILIRSGISSRDIANIMNVTSAAIEKNRYRIRKKFALSPDESLEKYILSF